MANQLRHRHGDVQLRRLRVDAGTVIEAGDLVFLDSDDVKPASDFTWDTDLATTQAAFAASFLGVAHTPSASGETDDVSVDVGATAVYQFDVPSATYEVGDELGPDEASSALADQQLEAVGSAGLAIARAAEYRTSAATLLKVTFASAFHTGSANTNAVIG